MRSKERVGIAPLVFALITLFIIVAAFLGFLLASSSLSSTSTTITTGSSTMTETTSTSNATSTGSVNTTVSSTSLSAFTTSLETTLIIGSSASFPTNQYAYVTYGGTLGHDGILIPANTVTWANFVYGETVSLQLSALVTALNYPDEMNTAVTVGIYGPNGTLIAESTEVNSVGVKPNAPNSTAPSGETVNQVVSPLEGANIQFSVNIQNISISQDSEFSVAFVANHTLWTEGWSQAYRAQGTGPYHGQSPWEVPATYEGTLGAATTLPQTLPQPSFESSFELAIGGDATWQTQSA